MSRTVAHCLVTDNKVNEEWLVRDEWAVLERLGLDPYKVAAELAESSPVAGQGHGALERPGRVRGHHRQCRAGGRVGQAAEPLSGGMRRRAGIFDEVWNQRLFNRVPAYFDRQIVCQTTRLRRVQGIDPYQIELVDLLASFPDFKVEVRDIAVLEGPELGLRIAVLWLLRGTYSGVPTYGPITRTPVNVLGVCHFEMRDGKVLREFRIVDEIAILAQIHAGRLAKGAA